MAARAVVLRLVELDGGRRCVDVFRRADGSHGFEEYRRDVEDGRGWFATGHHGARRFASAEAAMAAAADSVAGLAEAL